MHQYLMRIHFMHEWRSHICLAEITINLIFSNFLGVNYKYSKASHTLWGMFLKKGILWKLVISLEYMLKIGLPGTNYYLSFFIF